MSWFKKKVKKSAQEQGWSQAAILNLGRLLGFDPTQYDDGRLSEVTYFACLKILSEAVAKLPLSLQRVSEDGGVEDAVDNPFYQTVRVRPNPFMTPSSFWEAMENSRNHYGNAYAYIKRSVRGAELYPLSSGNMRVYLPQNQRLSGVQDIIYEYVYPETGETVGFASEDILHFKTSTTFGGLLGVSVQDNLRMSLDGAKDSQAVLNDLYQNNMTGRAVVQYAGSQEINSDLSRQFIQSMTDYAQGKKGTGQAFIPIPYGTTVTPLNLRLADEQFLELRKYTALQIASAFGIKPNQLNDYEKASYANSEAQQLAFYVETMLAILKQYEEELNFKLLTAEQIAQGYRFKFNVAAVLRGDTKAQVESLCHGIANGLYTPNEARRMLDLPSMEGGNRLYFNGSNVAVEEAGIQYQQQAALPANAEPTKAMLRLAESIEKACECGIMGSGKGWVTINGRHVFIGDDGGGGLSGSGGGKSSGSDNESEGNPDTGKVEQVGTVDYSDRQAVMQKLSEAEKEFADLPYEKCRTVTSDGKVWDTTGTSGTVDNSAIEAEGSSLVGSYSYHNHPANETYFSFSSEDAGDFIANREAVSIASDYKYRYVMERTGATASASYMSVYSDFSMVKNTTVLQMAADGKIDMDIDGHHETMKIISQQYGFKYRRVLRNGR